MTERAPGFDAAFLGESAASQRAYRDLLARTSEVLLREYASSWKPYSGALPQQLRELLQSRPVCPEESGIPLGELLDGVGAAVLRHSAVVAHPACIAHLHCPPLQIALAAELLISATNQSMDSWDQSMAGTLVEEQVIAWLCGLYGLGPNADGVFTSGGTLSNYMGLLLARDHYARRVWGWNVQQDGLPPAYGRLRVLCSADAHFTVRQSVAQLGLGENAVVPVEVDSSHRMRPDALERELVRLEQEGQLPFALVATAGTTDCGSIDPLPELAAIARRHELWLHTDAAYGGALALSDREAGRLRGLAESDSVTVDFHKWLFQPVSCGAFLLNDKRRFDYIRLTASYLNPEEDEDHGVPNLVTKSLQTTRRFDALKLYMSLQHIGRKEFGAMIEAGIDTARETAQMLAADPAFELLAPPQLSTVVFRYAPQTCPFDEEPQAWADRLQAGIRDRLLTQGMAVIARTKVNGRACLKMTLLNPRTTSVHTTAVLQQIKAVGSGLEQEFRDAKERIR
ncbi:aspartate aminotransferase family protein [Paenibacillus athensensis]|uniref:Aspartate aminotransferase family protein n=1 Tax=Paenibacillus athensensis TaxID=1967502 RepID=A0A4Y8Q4K1_9BACL|nr:aspartate aminotransferase family protein [Paenibacillus athensensis]MCD1258405.1 aspartate aminotransferase family protein [Paenibacillus athensensis]